MDLQVGGASRFRVGKGGTAFVTDSLTISSSGIQGSASLVVTSGRLQAQGSFDVSGYQIFFGNGWCSLSGSNSTGLTLAQLANGTGTFVLQPNSSGIVEQRTGVNAQTFRLQQQPPSCSQYDNWGRCVHQARRPRYRIHRQCLAHFWSPRFKPRTRHSVE